MIKTVLAWPRSVKRLVVVAVDIASALAATWLAFSLRLDTPHWPQGAQWAVYALSPVLAVPVFTRHGLYRSIFRYTGMAAMIATAKAVAIYAALFVCALLAMRFYGLAGRLVRTAAKRRHPATADLPDAGRREPGISPLLACGADDQEHEAQGKAADLRCRHLRCPDRRRPSCGSRHFSIVGFVDDDPSKAGRNINGVRIFASHEVEGVVRRFGVTDILLALPSVGRQRRRQILDGLQGLPVHIRTLPGIVDLASGKVTVQDFHELDIEDLLGREPVPREPRLVGSNAVAPGGHGDWSRRQHRQRTMPADRQGEAQAAGACGPQRVRALQHPPRTAGALPGRGLSGFAGAAPRERAKLSTHVADMPRLSAIHHLSRGSL